MLPNPFPSAEDAQAVTERRARPRSSLALAAALLALVLLAVPQVPAARAGAGLGAGIFSVDGHFAANVTLPSGGNYELSVATDDAASFVNASVSYNGSLLAQDNRSGSGSTPVSLPAGNYSVVLLGRGRAALGWDFPDGDQQTFFDNQTLVAFLRPSGPRLHVDVSLGDASGIALRVYDDGLLAAGNATVTASGSVDFVLPEARASFAYLVATVTAGNPSGLYGLAWSAAPLNAPLDLAAWPFLLLWIFVPVAIAATGFVLLHRRGGRAQGRR